MRSTTPPCKFKGAPLSVLQGHTVNCAGSCGRSSWASVGGSTASRPTASLARR